jgi:uncharacterized membrane protein YuzA (DUF378 family)
MLRRVLPRVGYVTVGLLWITIGVIAARIGLLGARDRVTGMPGALRVLLRQQEGPWILGAIAAGLAGFAAWRLMQAITGRDGTITRLGQALTGVGYAVLAWTTVRLLLQIRGRESLRRGGLAWLLTHPAGRLILQAAGAALIVAGLVAVAQGASGRLPRWLVATGLARSTLRSAFHAARFGLAARGVVQVITGYFLLRAVYDLDPREVHEVGGSLLVLSKSPLGPFAMGVVAVGLISYGVSMWILAISRRPA